MIFLKGYWLAFWFSQNHDDESGPIIWKFENNSSYNFKEPP